MTKTKKSPIYVFGHQNPDTDSICSAISYSYYKNQVDERDHIPVRLGNINKETRYALDYFKADDPLLLHSLKPQVNDLKMPDIQCLKEEDTLKRALGLIITQKGHILPIVDQDDKFMGIVSISDIAPAYMGLAGKSLLKVTRTPYKNIQEVLDGHVLRGIVDNKEIQGNIYTSSELLHKVDVQPEDVIIYTHGDGFGEQIFKTKAGLVIVAESLDCKEEVQIPDDFEGIVMAVQYTVFEIIKLVSQAIPVRTLINTHMLEYFQMDDYLDEVKDNMLSSSHRRFPVVDSDGFVRGMITRSNLLNINRKKVILVDHNEKGQSAKGIEEATIREVIDHHRIADIHTMSPLYFRAEPLGCTSTIISKIYEENEVEIPRLYAGLMLSAIISDTLLFHSPTCTKEDITQAKKLAKIAGVDINTYGMAMITAGTTIEGESPESLIFRDMKKFTFGKYKAAIAQINTTDFDGFNSIKESLVEEMEALAERDQLDLVLLMVTNIIVEGTELVAVGTDRWIAENAFSFEKGQDSRFLPQVYSRKKQVVPVIMNAARL